MNQDIQRNSKEYLSLADAAHEFGLSQDYLRFLIFKKKLKAEKIGRNWVTTKEWVLEQRQGASVSVANNPQPTTHNSQPTTYNGSAVNFDRLDSWAKRGEKSLQTKRYRLSSFIPRIMRTLRIPDANDANSSDNSYDDLHNSHKVFASFALYFKSLCKDKAIVFTLSLIILSAVLTFVDASPNTLYTVAEKAAARLAVLPHVVGVVEDFLLELEPPTPQEIAEPWEGVFNRIKTISFSDVKRLPAAVGGFILEYRPPTPRQFAENLRKDLRDIFVKAEAPSPKAAVTALRDIFEKAADGLFVFLKRRQTVFSGWQNPKRN
ncbi:MAG: hypothetical protein HYW90_01825 [Candidatus Sungbacteria bacterium]|nr:hypothetical protein [Candidatus Sungbacteria bacterium]